MTFHQKLKESMMTKESPVLLGLDPRPDLIPEDCFKKGDGSNQDTAEAFVVFAERLLDVLAPHVAAVKPQIAFYEALGLEGMKAYSQTLKRIREKGLVAIADIKRGDIGSTAEAYAKAHLEEGSDFEADAVTLNPWLGGDSLEPFFKYVKDHQKGVYLLLHTSNPGSVDLQEQVLESNVKLYEALADKIRFWQTSFDAEPEAPSIGVVVGATYPSQLDMMLSRLPQTPFLVPGYGSQGGGGADVASLFRSDMGPNLVNASRSLTYSYRSSGVSLEEGALKAVKAVKFDLMTQCPT